MRTERTTMTDTLGNAVNDQSARVTRIPVPIASPGTCAICGKSSHPKGFAATDNFDFDFYGTVYFCADCVGDYARVFGFISPEDLTEVMAKLTHQDEELELLRRSVTNLETLVDAYAKLHIDSGIVPPSNTLVAGSAEIVTEHDVEAERPVLSVVDGLTGQGESQDVTPDESPVSEGRNDVHDVSDELAELSTLFDV